MCVKLLCAFTKNIKNGKRKISTKERLKKTINYLYQKLEYSIGSFGTSCPNQTIKLLQNQLIRYNRILQTKRNLYISLKLMQTLKSNWVSYKQQT